MFECGLLPRVCAAVASCYFAVRFYGPCEPSTAIRDANNGLQALSRGRERGLWLAGRGDIHGLFGGGGGVTTMDGWGRKGRYEGG